MLQRQHLKPDDKGNGCSVAYGADGTPMAVVCNGTYAAEVQFHAYAVDSWHNEIWVVSILWYRAAIRADMGTGEDDESGFCDEYYDLDSDIVQAQIDAHGGY